MDSKNGYSSNASVEVLPTLCHEWSHLAKPTRTSYIKEEINTIRETVDATLTRLDEFRAPTEAIRMQSDEAATKILPELLERSQKLDVIFAKIDRLQNFINAVESSVEKCELRMEEVSDVYDQSLMKNRFRSLFGGRSKPQPKLQWTPLQLTTHDDLFQPQSPPGALR